MIACFIKLKLIIFLQISYNLLCDFWNSGMDYYFKLTKSGFHHVKHNIALKIYKYFIGALKLVSEKQYTQFHLNSH